MSDPTKEQLRWAEQFTSVVLRDRAGAVGGELATPSDQEGAVLQSATEVSAPASGAPITSSRAAMAPQPQAPTDLHSLTVEPAKQTVFTGSQQQFTATGLSVGGEQQDETAAVDWSASDPSVTFDAQKRGLAHIAPGGGQLPLVVTITATDPNTNITGFTTLTVARAPTDLASLNVEPAEPSVGVGGQVQFTARGLSAGGDEQDETAAVEWSASHPSVTFDAHKPGLAHVGASTGQRGPITITATDPNTRISGLATLTVTYTKTGDFYDVDRAYELGKQDGEDGTLARPAVVREIYKGQLHLDGYVTAYKTGFKEGTNLRARLLSPADDEHGYYAFELGVRDGRSGEQTHRKEFDGVQPEKGRPEPLKCYDAGYKDGQAKVPHSKQDAWEMGLSDGKLNDPFRRADVESTQNHELLDAYENGFSDGKAIADNNWDDVGAKVDAADIKGPSQDPGMSTYDKIMTGFGVLTTIISVLEAKGIIARAGIGTTLATLTLPIIAFKVGTDIGMAQEKNREAIAEFKAQLTAVVVMDTSERARKMAEAAKGPLREINFEGLARVVDLWNGWKSSMEVTIDKELDDSPTKATFVALYQKWVKDYSKALAQVITNPRFLTP